MTAPQLILLFAGTTAALLLLVRWAYWMDEHERHLVQQAEQLARIRRQAAIRTISGLVDVTVRGTLVSPRGVELPLHDGWSDLDALVVLAEIETL